MITIGTTVIAAASGTLPGRSLVAEHRLADEQARVADRARDDEVAEGEREGEDRAGDEAGDGERQRDAAEGRRAARAPRSAAASSSERGTRSRAAWIGRIMYGSQT